MSIVLKLSICVVQPIFICWISMQIIIFNKFIFSFAISIGLFGFYSIRALQNRNYFISFQIPILNALFFCFESPSNFFHTIYIYVYTTFIFSSEKPFPLKDFITVLLQHFFPPLISNCVWIFRFKCLSTIQLIFIYLYEKKKKKKIKCSLYKILTREQSIRKKANKKLALHQCFFAVQI